MIATKDASVVENLRNAGAIPIAVTNCSELCMWWETTNNLYGTTNNPYDTSKIAGGSSGGEGAIVSAAGSVCGVGSDVGKYSHRLLTFIRANCLSWLSFEQNAIDVFVV